MPTMECMALDLDGPDPLYAQIAEVIAGRIADGTYPPRRRIPSEWQLVEEFEVGRDTARRAVRALVERGLVHVVRGKGAFVTELDQRPQE
ncbi:GntR family transcriptional regulator [Streptomyces sp. MJP52]|uniref:GntR family transcriptional regulator n=1 Tax=Streptomyces sp. MJP52 TaxID=2940555 RepID=UPI002476E0FE|nr:GntR family transcriptional regulator [Streptomyces sp. MJP52]MDH6224376.1 GntR family transcriptional regulator [Streptomyces sp. MJP52]